jgi:hypothetical protein
VLALASAVTGCHEEIDVTYLAVDTCVTMKSAPAALLRSGSGGERLNHQKCARRAGAAIGIIHDLVYAISYTNRALAYR